MHRIGSLLSLFLYLRIYNRIKITFQDNNKNINDEEKHSLWVYECFVRCFPSFIIMYKMRCAYCICSMLFTIPDPDDMRFSIFEHTSRLYTNIFIYNYYDSPIKMCWEQREWRIFSFSLRTMYVWFAFEYNMHSVEHMCCYFVPEWS